MLGLMFILVILLVGFALGYGAREVISRRRHAAARRRRRQNVNPL
jgi:hypothetical protein